MTSDPAADPIDATERGVFLAPRELDTIRVSGPDRQSWLNGLVTANLATRAVGDAVLGLTVQKNGKIESEVVLLFGPDDVLMGVAPGLGASMVERLDRHLIMEDAALELLREGERPEWLFAFGAGARRALEVIAKTSHSARGGVFTRSGMEVAAIASTALANVIGALAGAIDPALLATPSSWDELRVVRGIAERGADYGPDNYPQEVAIERDAVSFEKGCYLGQEAVFMLEKRGHVSKRLVQLECDASVARGAPIALPDGKQVGEVTSALEHRPLALGYVKYKHARAGVSLVIGGVPARVTDLLAITEE